MAQNLMERLKAAMSPRARVADTETLLADLKAEQARLGIARDQAAAESVDFTLSEDDREEAAAKAGRLDRTIKGLDAEIAKVATLLDERRSDEARRAKEAEKRAALTERDELAARFAERVPAMMTELTGLLAEVKANADRMKQSGVTEADAEIVARGIPANGYILMTPVARFTEVKIPEWAGLGRIWPREGTFEVLQAAAAAEAERDRNRIIAGREKDAREQREKAEAAAKFAAEHGTYRIEVEYSVEHGDTVARIPEELVGGSIPATMGPWERRELVISHEVAAKLGAVPRFKVTPLHKKAAK